MSADPAPIELPSPQSTAEVPGSQATDSLAASTGPPGSDASPPAAPFASVLDEHEARTAAAEGQSNTAPDAGGHRDRLTSDHSDQAAEPAPSGNAGPQATAASTAAAAATVASAPLAAEASGCVQAGATPAVDAEPIPAVAGGAAVPAGIADSDSPTNAPGAAVATAVQSTNGADQTIIGSAASGENPAESTDGSNPAQPATIGTAGSGPTAPSAPDALADASTPAGAPILAPAPTAGSAESAAVPQPLAATATATAQPSSPSQQPAVSSAIAPATQTSTEQQSIAAAATSPELSGPQATMTAAAASASAAGTASSGASGSASPSTADPTEPVPTQAPSPPTLAGQPRQSQASSTGTTDGFGADASAGGQGQRPASAAIPAQPQDSAEPAMTLATHPAASSPTPQPATASGSTPAATPSTLTASQATSSPSSAPPSASTVSSSPGYAGAVRYGVSLQQTIDTVQTTIELAARQGSSQARIQLSPPSLGSISIRLQQTDEGLIAHVVADHAAAAQTLQQGGDDLRRSLESSGLTLLALDIESSGEQAAQTPDQSATAGGPEGTPTEQQGDTSGEASASEAATLPPDGARVNVLA